jgi:1,4-alpha-glucan branching enzyme
VYVEFVNPRAQQVAIAGSFNDWRPTVTPMVPMGRGWWVKGLVLPPGRYEYRLVVDGQPMPDPNATEAVPTPTGQVNSVLVVPADEHTKEMP